MSIFQSSKAKKLFIAGQWKDPVEPGAPIDVINPSDETVVGTVMSAGRADADLAVRAAAVSFESWSTTPANERADLLDAIGEQLMDRREALAEAVSLELGSPIEAARGRQATFGSTIWHETARLVRDYAWDKIQDSAEIYREGVGPVAVITPWNGPVTSVAKKLAAVLGAGCTAVSKPSEETPFSALLIAEAIEAAGAPAGIMNMIQGRADIGAHLAGHPDIQAVTLTGSVGAGVGVAKAAADSLKRLSLELGGKSANIIMDDAGFADAVRSGTNAIIYNSGQICYAPSRMLVPRGRLAEAEAISCEVAESVIVGPADKPGAGMGPLVSQAHMDRVNSYIQTGIDEGARLITGGTGRPDNLDKGFFVRPTVFSDVSNGMRIAQEEIFGPVLCIIAYDDLADAVRIANDTPFGLAAHISGQDKNMVRWLARALRAGSIYINGAKMSFSVPFGGYKMSGLGREHGFVGLEEFLEIKCVLGPEASG